MQMSKLFSGNPRRLLAPSIRRTVIFRTRLWQVRGTDDELQIGRRWLGLSGSAVRWVAGIWCPIHPAAWESFP